MGDKKQEYDKKHDYIDTIEKCSEIKFCDHIDQSLFMKTDSVHPCEVGSRIGILLSPQRELYFIINGIQYGPCTKPIPGNLDVYATADLYGLTKEIKILNYYVERLKMMCIGNILNTLTVNEIKSSCIPRNLKDEILRRSNDAIDEKEEKRK